MGIIQSIGNSLFRKQLAREHHHLRRTLKPLSIENSKNIGILYVISNEQEQNKITAFVNSLQNQKKEVRALGITREKIVPHFCFPKISFDYLTRSQINWYGKPSGDKVRDFVRQPFDILINTDLKNSNALHYISGISAATFKVGMHTDTYCDLYDFMIIPDGITSVEEFIRQARNSIDMFFGSKTV